MLNVCNILSLLSCPINVHIFLLLYVEDTHSKLASDTWSTSQTTLHQHLDWYLVHTKLTLFWWSIDWHSIVCLQKLFDSQLTVDQDVKAMLTKYWWRCRWSVDRRLIKVIDWHERRFFFSSHDLNTNHKSWAWKLEQSFLWVEVMML